MQKLSIHMLLLEPTKTIYPHAIENNTKICTRTANERKQATTNKRRSLKWQSLKFDVDGRDRGPLWKPQHDQPIIKIIDDSSKVSESHNKVAREQYTTKEVHEDNEVTRIGLF